MCKAAQEVLVPDPIQAASRITRRLSATPDHSGLFVGRYHFRFLGRRLEEYCDALLTRRDQIVRAHRAEGIEPRRHKRASLHDTLECLGHDTCLLGAIPHEARITGSARFHRDSHVFPCAGERKI